MNNFKILIVEDEKIINNSIKEILINNGFNVFQAFSGNEAKKLFFEFTPNIILLDIMLPDIKGTDLISTFRDSYNCGIIMLTALDDLSIMKNTFIDGADDYITKPFDIDILILKINALRRRLESDQSTLVINDLVINCQKNVMVYKNKMVYLQTSEMKVLRALLKAKEKDEILLKEDLNRIIYDTEQDIDSRVHAVYITKLRNKFKSLGYRKIEIENIYGKGYKLFF